jgi:phenylpropionate dioxygenase-like ring-hydroxylating dioxygenase large terminal subunit
MTGAAPSTDRIDNLHPGLRHAWHPVALSTELAAAPMRVRLLGESWVIARLPELVALPDRCPHRAAPLSRGRVVDNSIECPYHGWRFDQQGRVVVIPALGDGPVPSGCRSTPAAGVTEHLGLVWIAPEPPLAPLPDVPEWEAPGFTIVPLEPRRTTASAAATADNFLDVGHFPFLHAETFAADDPGLVPEYTSPIDGWRTSFVHEAPWDHPDGTVEHSIQRYEVTAPFSLRLRIELIPSGSIKTIVFFCQPEDLDSTRLYKVLVYNDLETDEEIASHADFETRVVDEDLAMLELLEEPWLALRPTAECHTRADRGGLAWRRLLRRLLDEAAT